MSSIAPSLVPAQRKLPAFVAPMLAKPGEPFDSDEHFFEVKWDGTRAMAYVDSDGVRLMNRRRADLTVRYPELEILRALPAGTMLDGEIVVLAGGKPDFTLLLSREQARGERRIRHLAAALPATYLVFDQVYRAYRAITGLPLSRRLDLLRETLAAVAGAGPVVVSQGIVGQGVRYFEEVCRQGLEGVMAKRLNSRYLPGKRSDAWIKIKPVA